MHDCSRYITNLVKECQELLNRDWVVMVQHIYREDNNVASRFPSVMWVQPNALAAHLFTFYA